MCVLHDTLTIPSAVWKEPIIISKDLAARFSLSKSYIAALKLTIRINPSWNLLDIELFQTSVFTEIFSFSPSSNLSGLSQDLHTISMWAGLTVDQTLKASWNTNVFRSNYQIKCDKSATFCLGFSDEISVVSRKRCVPLKGRRSYFITSTDQYFHV